MFKSILVSIILLALPFISNAQRLHLLDVMAYYNIVEKDPINAVTNITNTLKKGSSGWSGPLERRDGQYTCTWNYRVGQGIYGRLQFIVQRINGEPVPKVSYQCPYITAYDDFVSDLKTYGAELQDSYNENDGSMVTVFTLKGYTYMLARYPLSVSHDTVDGKPSAYFKMLMHPSI